MRGDFLEKIKKDVLIFDGALGTRLIAKGLDSGKAMQYNIENPDVIREIHSSYRQAGSDVLYSNTFGANSFILADSGYTVEEIIKSAYDNLKSVSNGAYLVYSCGPLGKLMYPTGELRFETAYEKFAEQAKIVTKLGFDAVVTETFTDVAELRTAILAFRENTNLPIMSSMSFDENGRTFAGNGLENFARIAEGLGVCAIGLNCGLGAEKTLKNALELSKFTNLPIFVKPNAGMPVFRDGKTMYDTDEFGFSEQVKEIINRVPNVHGIGGCCGTNEKYIAELKKSNFVTSVFEEKKISSAICSGQNVVKFDKFTVIGERLNPTGKPTLKKALKELDLDYVYGMCAEQIALGADVIDVNVGMAEIDEEYVLGEVVEYLSGRISVPLCIDTTKIEALSTALRRANGVVLINSVNGEERSMNGVFELAKRYGASCVCLCLDENGISDEPSKRVEIAKRILDRANQEGINKDRLLFDALTMAISVDDENGVKTLDTVKTLSGMGLNTTLGLSNVSFGLPQRERINGAFYHFAKKAGLNSAIINPALSECASDEVANNAVLGIDVKCNSFIEKYANSAQTVDKSKEHTVKECVYFGLSGEGAKRIREVANSQNYSEIITTDIISALNELGDDFGTGKSFLPQLMAGAETARVMLDYIKETYMSANDNTRATVVLATVKGDIHDIGKNIVKAVLSNYGYNVIDLGRDVPTEEVDKAIAKYNPRAVGLSALMTTTLTSMQETTRAIKEKYPQVLVLLGGAVVSSEFANKLGAEYSENAQECVKVLQKYGF